MADEGQALSTLGQPLVSPMAPVVTQDAVQKLADAYHQGFITTNDILEHTGALALKKGQTQEQLLTETLAPEAVQARKEQMVLSGEKAQREREDLLSKNFIDTYLKYNLPLKKADGTPDYSGMAEVGQKYADQERILQYAQMGVTGTPREMIEGGRKVVRMYNAFGEDITNVPGKTNKALEHYQKLLRDARSYLLQNEDEPEVPEGKDASQIQVSPKAVEAPAAPAAVVPTVPAAPAVAPVVEPFTPPAITPVVPIARAIPGVPSVANMGFESPAVAPVHVETANHSITVAPKVAPVPAVAPAPVVTAPQAYRGEGYVAGFEPGSLNSPKEIVDNLRSQETYKNWAEKTPTISRFRQIVASYANEKPGEVTTQKDLALATTALMLSMPGGGGSRGMPEMRARNIEEMQPLIEQVFHFVPKFLKKEAFTPETRQRIIEEATRAANGLESSAASSVKNAVSLFARSGQSPDQFLTEDERRLVTSPGGSPAGSSGASYEATTRSGRKILVGQ